MDISFTSYNCCSLSKNIDVIRKLTDLEFDVIFLQETFLIDDKLGDLDFIDERYESVGVGAKFSQKSLESMAGRPEGGMALLWQTNSPFDIDKSYWKRIFE